MFHAGRLRVAADAPQSAGCADFRAVVVMGRHSAYLSTVRLKNLLNFASNLLDRFVARWRTLASIPYIRPSVPIHSAMTSTSLSASGLSVIGLKSELSGDRVISACRQPP